MRKIVLSLISALVLGFGFANAASLNNTNAQSISMGSTTSALSASDEAMLFGTENTNTNAMVLGNEEMKNTQGFGFWNNFWDSLGSVAGAGAAAWAIAFLL